MKKKIILGIFSLAFAVTAINASNQNDDDDNNQGSENLFQAYGLYDTPPTNNNNKAPQFPVFSIISTNNNEQSNISPFENSNKIAINSPSPVYTDQRESSVIFSSNRNSEDTEGSTRITALQRLVELNDEQIHNLIHKSTAAQENNNFNQNLTATRENQTSPIALQKEFFYDDRQSPTECQTPISISDENLVYPNLLNSNSGSQILNDRYVAYYIERQQLFSQYLRAISKSAKQNTPSKRRLEAQAAKELGNKLTDNRFEGLDEAGLERLKDNLIIMRGLSPLTFSNVYQKLTQITESKIKSINPGQK